MWVLSVLQVRICVIWYIHNRRAIPVLLKNRINRHLYLLYNLLSFLSYFLSLFLHPCKEKAGPPSGFFFFCGSRPSPGRRADDTRTQTADTPACSSLRLRRRLFFSPLAKGRCRHHDCHRQQIYGGSGVGGGKGGAGQENGQGLLAFV